MTRLLALPMLPGAALVALLSALALLQPGAVAPLALVAAVAGGGLAVAAADRPRRILWSAFALCAVLAAARTVLDLPWFDARSFGPFPLARDALGLPLRRLVPEPEAGILLGIVLGERAGIGPELREAFARSGTTHLLAISGFNMTLVAAGIALALRGRVSPRLAAGVTVGAIAAYSVLVGLAPSVVRAALMAAVVALAFGSGRRGVGANALSAAAAAMLLADPSIVTDVAFLLSASATGGLLAWQAPLAERLRPLPALAREGLATTLAATAPTMPLVAAFFGRVSLVSPLANVIAVPLFPPLMLAGAATAAVGAVALDAARPLALAAYALATALRSVVEISAAFPLASLDLPAGPGSGLLVGAAVAACVLVLALGSLPRVRAGPDGGASGPPGGPFAGVDGDLRPVGAALEAAGRFFGSWRPGAPTARHRTAAAIVLALVVLPLSWFGTSIAVGPAGLRVLALDVGQGDAFLVQSDGRVALIDGGPDGVRLLALLSAHLPPWHRRIDLVVLTHAHLDHGAGLLAVLDRYEVGLAVEPERLDDVPLAALWAEGLARSGTPRRALSAGMRVHLGAAVLVALSPNGNPRVGTPNLVLRLERGDFSMLFSADAEDAALADLLLAPERLRARVYVPPHHGAATPHGAALADAVGPEVAILSVGASNRYGHPTPETLAALGTLPVYRTDRDGTVEIAVDGHQITVRTGASGLPPPRGGRVPGTPPAR